MNKFKSVTKNNILDNLQSNKIVKVPTVKNLYAVKKIVGSIFYNTNDKKFYGWAGNALVTFNNVPSFERLFASTNLNPNKNVSYIAGSGSYTLPNGSEGFTKIIINNVDSQVNYIQLGNGLNDVVYSVKIDNSNVYFGGDFTSDYDSGINLQYITMWNPITSTWSSLGPGLNDRVVALATYQNNLIVGGEFTSTFGNVDTLNYIAQWDGSQWQNLNSGFDSTVSALAVDSSGTLYAGGDFTMTFGAIDSTLNYIAQWNGSQWISVGPGPGLNGLVKSICGDSAGNIYVGGQFTATFNASDTLNRIGKWTGSAWEPIGPGFSDNEVKAVAIDSKGTLYAGGGFTSTFNGTPNGLKYIAKWTGTEWVNLNPGLNGSIEYIVPDTFGNIYVGGYFTGTVGADQNILNYIAQWNGLEWKPVGQGFDSQVHAIDINANNIYTGGYFTTDSNSDGNYNYVAQISTTASPVVTVESMIINNRSIANEISYNNLGDSTVLNWNGSEWVVLSNNGGTFY